MERFYCTTEWRDLAARAKARDGHRCTVARLFGGSCSEELHAHHLVPVSEGGPEIPGLDGVVTVCAAHHPTLHAIRRYLQKREEIPPCRHQHRYDHARRACRARRLREAGIERDLAAA
jgi:hypothetical protein